MLTYTHLGQSSPDPLNAQEELEYVRFVTIGEQVENAYSATMDAFRKMQLAAVLAGGQPGSKAGLPETLLAQYEKARQSVIAASIPWLDFQKQVPEDQLPPQAKIAPLPPPPVEELFTNGTNGLGNGLGRIIPFSALRVRVGTQSIPLGDPALDDYFAGALTSRTPPTGLGNPAIFLIVFIALGVAVVGLTVAIVIKEVGRAKASKLDALARLALADALKVKNAGEALSKTQLACIGTSTDPKVRERCTIEAGIALEKATPDTKAPPEDKGLGVLGTIGLVVVVAGVAVGGYVLYRRRRDRKMETSKAMVRTEARAEVEKEGRRRDTPGRSGAPQLVREVAGAGRRRADKARKNTPSPEQLAAIRRFAERHGRTWKSALNAAWMRVAYDFTARESGDDALLQQVRNNFGPSWLHTFQLKEIAGAHLSRARFARVARSARFAN
jgi:hypothetical protein